MEGLVLSIGISAVMGGIVVARDIAHATQFAIIEKVTLHVSGYRSSPDI